MVIRKATIKDIPVMIKVYQKAKDFMDSTGNPNQWPEGYPKKEVLEYHIKENSCYVILDDKNTIHGAFVFYIGLDSAYDYIEGSWLNNKEYGVIHMVCSDGSIKGVFSSILNYVFNLCPNIRIDTYKDNKVMQHLLEKFGFTYCGIIYLEDKSPRLAYQKQLLKKNPLE
ncbi:MAG: GNAT family N-acetyltransferase [Sphaerochaetaceae bacterium]|nr:GNAT family N-acetyltransferase [Sphaerochaetaceae bacterium]